MKTSLYLILCLFSINISAYEYLAPKLIIQSSLTNGYELPPRTLFTDSTPSINDKRQLAMTLGLINGEEIGGVWNGDVNGGKISYFRTDLNRISNVVLNNLGTFSFTVNKEGEDISFYQASKASSGYSFKDLLKLEVFWDYASFSNVRFTGNKHYFSAINFRNNKSIYYYNGQDIKEIEQENNRRSKNKISFLFGPTIHASGKMVYKARLGEKGDWAEVRSDLIILNDHGKKTIIASDKDYDKKSPWSSFRNSASTNIHGQVAFVAKNLNGKNQLVVSDGKVSKIIATEGKELQSITYFTPIINNDNWVAFRGITLSGKHAVFVANENKFQVVIEQFQTFETPLGEREFAYGKHIPFGGNISFNNRGDLAVNTGLSSNNQNSDKGKALIVILTK